MHYASILALAAASAVSAATIKVDVGKNGLTYTPNDITAAVGDGTQDRGLLNLRGKRQRRQNHQKYEDPLGHIRRPLPERMGH